MPPERPWRDDVQCFRADPRSVTPTEEQFEALMRAHPGMVVVRVGLPAAVNAWGPWVVPVIVIASPTRSVCVTPRGATPAVWAAVRAGAVWADARENVTAYLDAHSPEELDTFAAVYTTGGGVAWEAAQRAVGRLPAWADPSAGVEEHVLVAPGPAEAAAGVLVGVPDSGVRSVGDGVLHPAPEHRVAGALPDGAELHIDPASPVAGLGGDDDLRGRAAAEGGEDRIEGGVHAEVRCTGCARGGNT